MNDGNLVKIANNSAGNVAALGNDLAAGDDDEIQKRRHNSSQEACANQMYEATQRHEFAPSSSPRKLIARNVHQTMTNSSFSNCKPETRLSQESSAHKRTFSLDSNSHSTISSKPMKLSTPPKNSCKREARDLQAVTGRAHFWDIAENGHGQYKQQQLHHKNDDAIQPASCP